MDTIRSNNPSLRCGVKLDVLPHDARKPKRSPPVRQTRLFRWIRWTAGLLLVLMIALPTMAADQVRNLKFVSTAWAPFTNAPGQPRFALDLVEAAMERIGGNAETVIVDEARLTPSLLDGEFDGSAAVWKEADRERVLIYSEPYLENRLILVGRQGSDVSVTSLAALAGNRIALVAGYAYGEAAKAKEGPIIVGSIKSGPHRNRTGPTQVRYLHVQDLAGDGSEPVSRERENEGCS